MDTSLYSMGAYFSDEHPDLIGEVIAQSEAIEAAGLRAYAERNDMTPLGLLRDAAHRPGGSLLQRRRGVGAPGWGRPPVASAASSRCWCSVR